MKKVLYVIGYPLRMTGSQKQIEQLILHLPADIEPTVLLSLEADVARNFRDKGVKVAIIDPGSSLNSYGKKLLKISLLEKIRIFLKEYWAYSRLLKQYIEEENFDLIHCNDGRAVILIGLAQIMSRTKMISHMQGDRAFRYNIYWLLFELLPEKIIMNAQFIRHSLSFIGKLKALTIYTGISKPDTSFEISPWLQAQKCDGHTIFGIFASVVPFKGYHHLIDAIKILVYEKKVTNFLCLCIGNFPEEYNFYHQWIFERIQTYNLGQYIQFTGWTNSPGSYMEFCDFTTLPSVFTEILDIKGEKYVVKGNEGFPTVHLESMLLEKPIIGTKIAGVPEQIIDSKNGFIVPPSDAEALSEALLKLIQDPKLCIEMGALGLKYVQEKFTLHNYVDSVLSVYDNILGYKI